MLAANKKGLPASQTSCFFFCLLPSASCGTLSACWSTTAAVSSLELQLAKLHFFFLQNRQIYVSKSPKCLLSWKKKVFSTPKIWPLLPNLSPATKKETEKNWWPILGLTKYWSVSSSHFSTYWCPSSLHWPNQQRPLNKFRLSSKKSAPSPAFLDQNFCQNFVLKSSDWAYDLMPNMDKDVDKAYVY